MVIIRDATNLQASIIRSGYSYSGFARQIGMSRAGLYKAFRRKTVSPYYANKIAEELKRYDEFFLITKSPKGHAEEDCKEATP